MSLLDIIKNLFCGKSAQKEEVAEQPSEVVSTPVVKPEPVVEEIPAAVVEPVAEPSPVVEAEKTEPQIPEDSTLRRHYLANLEAQKQPKYVEPVIEDKPEAVVAEETETVAEPVVEAVAKCQIPEDSALRRHFIAGLQAEIEAGMPARPTDASLRRHYEAEVQAELDKLLS